ncbi:MAG: hybrid sensor histidine kinase/response regulator [Verrucomicrobia bacterium]|nr:hybrid sensor histidine kinase/response regulator [Verrucomicrobiota bacterium]
MIAPAQPTREKVLIVDDELGPRESLRMLLKNDYEVLCATSVDDGLDMVENEHPDLVFMDIRMPGKTGIEGLRELRSHDQQTSVVMLTGFGALETAQEAIRLGANDYVNKPFDMMEMRTLVRQFMDRSKLEKRRSRMLKELQDMNSRLMEDLATKEHLASVGQSSAEVAHDLRNPLMIVTGYVNLLTQQLDKIKRMMGNEYDQASQYLEIIEKNIRICCDLAEMWHGMGRSDMSRFAPLKISQVIDDLIVGIEPLVMAVNVEVEYQVNPGDATVNGSRGQLLRAIHNLISNAIDAIGDGRGRILLVCERRDSHVEIRVEDNGIGMSDDVLERMFEPYFTTKYGKGTGLGTVISRRIIEEHKGMIDVESKVGHGTIVRVLLPLI